MLNKETFFKNSFINLSIYKDNLKKTKKNFYDLKNDFETTI